MSKALVLAASLVLVAAGADAQNLLANPGFATNLSGWSVLSDPPASSVAWNSLNASGNPGSGSARITNQHPSATTAVGPISQCVSVVGGGGYTLSAQFYLPPGQSRTGFGQALLYWYTGAGCASGPSLGGAFNVSTVGVWLTTGGVVTAPNGAHSARLSLRLQKQEGGGALQVHADNVIMQLGSPPTCTPSATTLCIDDEPGDRRFRVTSTYQTVQQGGLSGSAHAVDLDVLGIHQGGVFWFFNAGNPELLIKVLNGCPLNGKYWVFFSAGTNVGFTVDVLDTVTGQLFSHTNPDLTPAPPVQATSALPCG